MDEQPRRPRRGNTQCPDCQGERARPKPTIYVGGEGPRGVTLVIAQPCPTCAQTGWLPGIRPPM